MKTYFDLTPILDSLSVEVFIDPYTDQATISEEKYDEWNESYPTFLSFFAGQRTRYHRDLSEALKHTLFRILLYIRIYLKH